MGLLHDGQFPPRTMGNVPEHKQCPSDFLLGSERAEEYAFSLYGTSSTFWNRLVRTRMLGGVRGRGLAAPSYSILQSAEFTSETSSFGGGLSDPVLSVPSLFTPLEFLF